MTSWFRRYPTTVALAIGLSLGACKLSNPDLSLDSHSPTDRVAELVAEIIGSPFIANPELHSRLATLEFVGLPYRDLSALMDEIEHEIQSCMARHGLMYRPVPGTLAAIPVLSIGVSSTTAGYFPFERSEVDEILTGAFEQAQMLSMRERGENSQEYFQLLHGRDPTKPGGCSGKALVGLGDFAFDDALHGASRRLQEKLGTEQVAIEAIRDFEACLGSDRDSHILSLESELRRTVEIGGHASLIKKYSRVELTCIQATLRSTDANIRNLATEHLSRDQVLKDQMRKLASSLRWSVSNATASR